MAAQSTTHESAGIPRIKSLNDTASPKSRSRSVRDDVTSGALMGNNFAYRYISR